MITSPRLLSGLSFVQGVQRYRTSQPPLFASSANGRLTPCFVIKNCTCDENSVPNSGVDVVTLLKILKKEKDKFSDKVSVELEVSEQDTVRIFYR